MKATLAVLATPFLLMACAANEVVQDNANEKEETVYITGSNIPKKKSSVIIKNINVDSFEETRRLANPAANKGG